MLPLRVEGNVYQDIKKRKCISFFYKEVAIPQDFSYFLWKVEILFIYEILFQNISGTIMSIFIFFYGWTMPYRQIVHIFRKIFLPALNVLLIEMQFRGCVHIVKRANLLPLD